MTSWPFRTSGLILAKTSGRGRATVGGDKAYDVRDFVRTLRFLGMTPHLAMKSRYSASASWVSKWIGIASEQSQHQGHGRAERVALLTEHGP